MTGSGNRTSGDLASNLQSIAAAATEAAGSAVTVFADPAKPASIARMESTIAQPLPDSFRDYLSLHDGQADDSPLKFPPDDVRLLSSTAAIELWTELQEYRDDQFFDEFADEDRVRQVMYHPGRLPIAYNELATAYVFLDLVPGPKGSVGQLIFNPNEVDLVVLEPTVHDFFAGLAHLLDSKKVRIEKLSPEFGEGVHFVSEGHVVDGRTYLDLARTRK